MPPSAATGGDRAATGMLTPKSGGPSFFVLGVWVQPVSAMDTWKARGVNTLVEVPQGHDVREWIGAADARGFYQIRHPSEELAADLGDAYLLAWSTLDEPSDTQPRLLAKGFVHQDPIEVAKEAAPWRATALAAGKHLPIWTNHVAGHIYSDWAQHNALMHDYMEGPESDWLSADAYAIEAGQDFVIETNDGYVSTPQGVTLDRQLAWSGGKPTMAFIGVSAFSAGGPWPSVGVFNVMAWSSVIHGASGVIYFPVQFSPAFSFDATPPDVVAAITTFDYQIANLEDVLMDGARGRRRPFKLYRSSSPRTPPANGQLPYPFEAAEIPAPDGTCRIILNLSGQNQVLNKPAWKLNNAAFRPYEVRIGYGTASDFCVTR